MKVRITFEVDEHDRLAIANHYGLKGAAPRRYVLSMIEDAVRATLEDMRHDLDRQDAREQP